MKVRKRDGRLENVDFNKIYQRLEKIRQGVTKEGQQFAHEIVGVDINVLVQKVISQVTDGISTSELDQYAAITAATMVLEHPGFSQLAGRILISNHHRETYDYYTTCKFLYENKDAQGNPMPLLDHVVFKIIQQNRTRLEQAIDYNRDFRTDFFGFKTLEKSYLLRTKGEISVFERPQHMWMRVAVGIHREDIDAALETYNELSMGRIMHATPTLFNAGCPNGQFLSCFLMDIEDSLQGIFDGLRQTALISKSCGGLGHSFSSLRAANSRIRGTNGTSRGIVPICKVYNETARLVDQSGRRKGSFAIYLEVFHADLMEFLDLKKTHGSMDMRALDLFYALWVCDLFMKRVEKAVNNPKETVYWSLMCPDECPGLTDCYGKEFEELYTKYEKEGRYRRQLNVLEVWSKILDSQKETGTPYMTYKDHACYKSGQKNIGILKSSNLCVSGDTMILTKQGYHPIKSLHNREVEVWNGEQWSRTVVNQTGFDQEMVQVDFSNGLSLTCTPYHRFYVKGSNGDVEIMEARELNYNCHLIDYQLPVVSETDQQYQSENVPINANIETRISWVKKNLLGQAHNFSVNQMEYYRQVVLLLQTLGCDARLTIIDPQKYVLDIDQENLHKVCNRSDLVNKKAQSVGVVRVTKLKEKMDTYCFTEHYRSMGVFNGLITGQCAEIFEVSTPEETACCNLASIPLSSYVTEDGEYDFEGLAKAASILTKNLDKIIDLNVYPTPQTEKSNKLHRPCGLGIQGLADTFYMLKIPFESDKARELNRQIFETIQYSALKTSMELAREKGPYKTFKGSPASQGLLQPDLWEKAENRHEEGSLPSYSGRYDWDDLRKEIKEHGLRNSLLTALMPTASSAQILGNIESFEPIYSNLFVRGVLSGEFIVCNKHLQKDLLERNLWKPEITRQLVRDQGSVQQIKEIPEDLRNLYKTVFEIKQKVLLDLSADRAPFIDQSQSLNWFVKDPTNDILTSMHLYTWKKGLKTSMYYLRRKAISSVSQFTVRAEDYKNKDPKTPILNSPLPRHPSLIEEQEEPEQRQEDEVKLCLLNDPDCLSCQG